MKALGAIGFPESATLASEQTELIERVGLIAGGIHRLHRCGESLYTKGRGSFDNGITLSSNLCKVVIKN